MNVLGILLIAAGLLALALGVLSALWLEAKVSQRRMRRPRKDAALSLRLRRHMQSLPEDQRRAFLDEMNDPQT